MTLPNNPFKIKGNKHIVIVTVRARGESLPSMRGKSTYEGKVHLMRGRSTNEGKVNLSRGGSPPGQRGEYTCEGEVDLGEGTVYLFRGEGRP